MTTEVKIGIQQGWGRQIPKHMINHLTSTWGARAIYTGQQIDLLPDRQGVSTSIEDDEAAKTRLLSWINKVGLPYLRQQAPGLYQDEDRTVQLDDNSMHIEANPQRSYGYLYIRAWEVALSLDTETHRAMIASA